MTIEHKKLLQRYNNAQPDLKHSFDEYDMLEELIRENIDYFSDEDQLEAIQLNPFFFTDIINPTERVVFASIKMFPWLVEEITEPTHEMIIFAASREPEVLMSFTQISEDLQFKLFSINNRNIEYIMNPCERLQQYIFENHIEMVKYINNVTIPKIKTYQQLIKN